MATRAITDAFTLATGSKMPQLGFGVYRSPTNVCVNSCLKALESGYRHIDTAQLYRNEKEVGLAIQQTDIPRKEIFITTKIMTAGGSVEKSYQKCLDSVQMLDSENGYVDLFLVHTPNGGAAKRKEMWLALEKLYEEGRAKSIGVSNFGIKHINELKEFAKVWPPHVNQIELHPWMQQREIVEYCEKNDIIVQAYCPLVRNMKSADETLVGIAEKQSVTPSQVLIRYALQKRWVPLPKSDHPERIRANADVFGFNLEEEDMSALDALDQGPAGAIVQAVSN
ncbi:putative oxidoreductase C2F3.05c [Cladobotryum mycophilum]|uniref:Oxidoreductase C2F3.05c n=1 Tax=Cladobotryum mycophilum TaxID=491253 RepID=A0ABR0SID1_9HYPO